MKLKSLLYSSGFVATAVLSLTAVNMFNNRATFAPRESNGGLYNQSVELMKKMRGNLTTGNFEVSDVTEMTLAVNDFDRNQSADRVDMSWWEMGPDNIGGRTRAILAYTNDVVFAGSVTGGLYKSTNGGNNWSRVESLDSFGKVMAISSIDATEDGTIYVATGSQFESGFDGSGASGSIGCGMFRSTDQGASWELVPGTDPADLNAGDNWAYINDISADANVANRIWIAGADGVGYWEPGMTSPNMSVSGIPNTGGHDIEWSQDGTVCYVGVSNGRVYRSTDGGTSFAQVGASQGLSNKQRVRLAISRDDSNVAYVLYAAGGQMGGLYYTSDKGDNWEVKWPTGIDNLYSVFGDNGQAYYDLALGIKPGEPGICWVGGVTLWKAGANTQPEQIAANFDFGSSQYYVHSDIHTFEIAPNGDWYIGCDGGVFKSVDGGNTFASMNRGYNVTQFYGIAHGGGYAAMGGTQDNGTILIPGMEGPFDVISWQQGVSVGGGDGFDCDITNVTVPGATVAFSTVYFGAISRFNQTGAGGEFYDDEVLAAIGDDGEAGSFYTACRLYENTADENSQQYVILTNNRDQDIYSYINGNDTVWVDTTLFTQNMTLPFNYRFPLNDTLNFWPVLNRPAIYSTTPITEDPNYPWLDPQALTGIIDSTICDTTIVGYEEQIDQITQQTIWVYWSDTVINPINGSQIIVNDSTEVVVAVDTTFITVPILDIQCTSTTWYYYAADQLENVSEQWQVQDQFTSLFVTGFFGTEGMWVTRQALNFNTTPDWWKIGNAPGSGVRTFEWSEDGNTLYYSSWSGSLYRVTGFQNLWSAADVSNLTTTTLITNAGGTVTSIASDPNDPNHLVFTVGGYGAVSGGKVRESFNALAATPTFTNIWVATAPLNKMPIYASVIDVNDATGNTIVVGTEYGVWATNDGGTTWTHSTGVASSIPADPMAGASVGSLGYVPVFDLRQQQTGIKPYMNPQNFGTIYAGTHGRGIFRSDDFYSVGVNENTSNLGSGLDMNLNVYPNPTMSNANLNLELSGNVNQAYAQIYALNGQMVNQIQFGQLTAGSHQISLQTENLPAGQYIVKVFAGSASGTAKLIRQ
ncbi:MAG: T9SS type A sorting domain-containing protein [Bacteroidetes bacterium]|nr:T9SS type A sorting domain-containing protein [Bacteroidota bacterium]